MGTARTSLSQNSTTGMVAYDVLSSIASYRYHWNIRQQQPLPTCLLVEGAVQPKVVVLPIRRCLSSLQPELLRPQSCQSSASIFETSRAQRQAGWSILSTWGLQCLTRVGRWTGQEAVQVPSSCVMGCGGGVRFGRDGAAQWAGATLSGGLSRSTPGMINHTMAGQCGSPVSSRGH